MAKSSEITNLEQVTTAIVNSDKALSNLAGTYLTLVKNMGDATEKAKTHTKTVDDLTKAQKEAADAQKILDAANKALADSEAKLNKFDKDIYEQIQRNNKALADQKKAINDKIKAGDAEEGSLVRMRQKLSELTKEYDKTGTRTKAAADEINKLSREIGKAEAETNRHQRGVGGYADQLGHLSEKYSSLPGPIGDVAEASGRFMSILTKLGPIGLIIVGGLTAIGAPLYSFLTKSEEGVELLERKVAGFKAAWGVLVGEMISGGEKMASVFNKPEEKIGTFWTKILSLLGPAWLGVGANMDIASNSAEKYTGKLQEMEKSEIKLIVPRSEANLKIKEARLLYADATKSLTERVDGLKTAVKLENETAEVEVNHQHDVVENLKVINNLKKISGQLRNEDDRKLQEAIAKENELRTESVSRQIRAAKSIQTGTKELLDQQKTDLEKALKDKLNIIELNNDKEVKSINQVHIAGLSTDEEYKKDLSNQESNFLNDKLKLYKSGTKEYEDLELKLQELRIKSTDENEKALLEKEKDAAKERIEVRKAEQKTIEDLLKESEKDEEKIMDSLDKETEDRIAKELKDSEKAAEKKKEIAEKVKDMQIQIASEAVNGAFDLGSSKRDAELDALDKERDKKLSNEKLTAAQKEKINEEYDKKAAAIKTKQAKADKLQSMFNIALDTFKGSMKAVAESPETFGLPFLPWVIAQGALQLALVAAKPIPKYKDGGTADKGFGIFGEAGLELMFPKAGGVLMANKATYFEGSKFKGARIVSNPDTEKMIAAAERSGTSGSRGMTDDRIVEGLASLERTLKNKPVQIVDKDHKTIGFATSNSQTIYLNRILRN